MPRLPRHPRFWLAAFLLWFGLLWLLSSFSSGGAIGPSIPHFDKVAHFGYFFGGSVLLSGYLFFRRPARPDWKWIIITAVSLVALTGCLDEWHQSFTPGRSGNDPYDWLADVLGATAGALAFKRFHRRLQ